MRTFPPHRFAAPMIVAALALPLLPARAATQSGSPQASPSAVPSAASPYQISFEKYALPNGLEVILHRDASLPLVAVNLWYHVGPANEPVKRSGFAHLFEHLMFEGSKHAGRKFDHLLEAAGATNANGTTSWDRTNYFETVPREHLELVLWLESDRMGFMLDALDQKRLDVQRGVVKNERRQRHENSPYGPSELALYDTLFPPGHPYHGAIIGSMEDLSSATLDDVRAFFESFYAPSNATLTIAGDYDANLVKGWVERYFGTLPARPKPPRRRLVTPPLTAEKRLIVKEPVQLGKLSLAWITPPAFTPDDAVLDVTSSVLAGGRATRLYQELVVRQKLCTDVRAYVDSNELASVFSIEATLSGDADPGAVERAIESELTKLSAQAPSSEELARAKRGVEFSVRQALQELNGGGGESGRAGILQRMNHYLGDPGALPRTMARLLAVTGEDVRGSIAKHLGRNSRVVLVTQPLGAGEEKTP